MVNSFKRSSFKIIQAMLICIILFGADIYAQSDNQGKIELGDDFYYFYGIEDYINVEVDVASMFQEEDLVVGSTVSRITPNMWRRMGARRYTDALETQTAMVSYPSIFGFYTTAIRGYSRDAISTKGVVTLLDGVPVIEIVNGTNDGMPNVGLGCLSDIEIIKGPGSSIYGSDAFHGVVAMNTFESEEDRYEIEGAGAYPLYGDASFRVSHGIGKYLRVNATAGYNQQIASEELEYNYYSGVTSDAPVAGKGEYENRYRTATGVLKMDITPFDKMDIILGSYIINNKCEDFSGVKENDFMQLHKYDLTSQDSTIYIYRGGINYNISHDITFEVRGYYWYWDMLFSTYNTNVGSYADFYVDEKRLGFDAVVKQKDNTFNFQWLVAFSSSYSSIEKKVLKTYDRNGQPYYPYTDSIEGSYQVLPDEGMDRTINSFYAQTKWGVIKKKLFLLLGGRLDNYSDWSKQLTPRCGIIFLPDKDSSVKTLYGRAFRAPSGNAIYGVSTYILGNKDIKPEVIDIFELVYIYKWKDWKLNLNGFYSKWKDGIIIEPFTANAREQDFPAEFTNSGKNRAYGGEANFFCSIDPFAIDLGGSYVKSTAIDLKTVQNLSQVEPADYDYETFPEYIIIAGLHYNMKYPGVNFYLKNRIYLNMKETPQADEKDHLPQYWRVDLNINKHIQERLELYLDIRNLTNRKNYLPSLYTSVLAEEDGIPEAGISMLFRISYKI